MPTRREVLMAGMAAASFHDHSLDFVSRLVCKGGGEPEDEDFWTQIQQAFVLDRNVVNFNNGGCSPAPRVVQDALRRQLEFSNQAPSHYMWRILEPEVESVRRRLADLFGCDAEEMAITRNASESLETVLLGMDMEPGDEILTTDMDYPRMITTIQQRERRDGVKMVQVKIPPIPESPQELTRYFADAVTDRTRLILVSQVSFLNGQIFPVRDIVDLGRRRGIPVLVDGAHAFVQYKFNNHDLSSDLYGASLHKWLMAPIGTGFLHVAKSLIPKVWPLMAAPSSQVADIRKYEEIGTHPAANHNAIGEALTFHEMIGIERKEARFRYLRRRWTDKLQGVRGIRWATSLDDRNSCALTTVGIEGIAPPDLASWLLSKHAIFVTTIGTETVQGIRVTPNVYSTLNEVDRFAEAMLVAAKHGIV